MAHCQKNQMAPSWTKTWLKAAAIYNLIWGSWVIFFPSAYFHLVGLTPPTYLSLWQCIGMISAVFGIGYAIAATNPVRHWAIVLVGLLGKILVPVGFVWAVIGGSLPVDFIWTILTNDLIWWAPFAVILYVAMKGHFHTARPLDPEDSIYKATAEVRAASGKTIDQISAQQPVLMVFLRHFGCTFCKESLKYIKQQQEQIEADGTRIVFVHMSSPERGEEYFRSRGFVDFDQISDPDQRLYQLFRFSRASFGQIFGPGVLWRGLKAGFHGFSQSSVEGDAFQMPGLVLITHGMPVRVHRYKTAAEVPNYSKLAACPEPVVVAAAEIPPCAHRHKTDAQSDAC
jgi:peroxiredoxin